MASRFATLDEYLASLTEEQAQSVRAVVEAIQNEYPTATVKIAWNTPQIQIDGQYVFGVSAAKNWLMLASWQDDFMLVFADRLAAYETNKRTFRVPLGWTPDRELLRDLIAARLSQLGA